MKHLIDLRTIIVSMILTVLVTNGGMLGFAADKTLKAGVSAWTIDKAREEAFKDIQPQINTQHIQPVDPDYAQNKNRLLKHQKALASDAVFTVFGNGTYSVRDDTGERRYYYDPKGLLYQLDIYDHEDTFPNRGCTYNFKDGRLTRIVLEVSPTESYVFRPNGKLQYRWDGNRCYTVTGKSCGVRQKL